MEFTYLNIFSLNMFCSQLFSHTLEVEEIDNTISIFLLKDNFIKKQTRHKCKQAIKITNNEFICNKHWLNAVNTRNIYTTVLKLKFFFIYESDMKANRAENGKHIKSENNSLFKVHLNSKFA